MKQFSFRIPGLPENKQTLAQPASLRILPWLLLIPAVIWLAQTTLAYINFYATEDFGVYALAEYTGQLLGVIAGSIVGLFAAYFVGRRLRMGDRLFFWGLLLVSGYSVISLVHSIVQFPILGIYSFSSNLNGESGLQYALPWLFLLIRPLVDAVVIFLLIKHQQQLLAEGEVLAKELPPRKLERVAAIILVVASMVIPLIPIFYQQLTFSGGYNY